MASGRPPGSSPAAECWNALLVGGATIQNPLALAYARTGARPFGDDASSVPTLLGARPNSALRRTRVTSYASHRARPVSAPSWRGLPALLHAT